MARFPVSKKNIQTYQEDGALCLRGVFGATEVGALQDAVEEELLNPGPYAKEFAQPGEARFVGAIFVSSYNETIREVLINSELGEIAGKLMGARQTRFFFDHLLVKEPGASKSTPWHQDAPYFALEGVDCCGIWIALDTVTPDTGAVEYLKGTHKDGLMYAPRSFAAGKKYGHGLVEVPDIDANRDAYEVATWSMEPGDCSIHHVRTLHGAPGNETNFRRRGLATRWIGDDAVFGLRSGIPDDMTTAFKDLAPDLRPGDGFNHPMFPVVWKQN